MHIANVNDNLAKLEHILLNLPLVEMGIDYDDNAEPSPAYLLKTKREQLQTTGYFAMEKGLRGARIGFTYEDIDKEPEYYDLNVEGGLTKYIKNGNSIYLPLKHTGMTSNLSSILGIEGNGGLHPLLYFQDTSRGTIYRGLSRDEKGQIQYYPIQGNEELDQQVKAIFTNQIACKKIYDFGENPLKKDQQGKIEIISKDGKIDCKKPSTIVDYLDEYIISQNTAKKRLAGGMSKYVMMAANPDVFMKKSNMIVIGPTGTGKSYMVKKALEKLGIPYVITSASTNTSEGYKGGDITSAFEILRKKTKDQGEAPYAAIFIDEIDKRNNKDSKDAFGQPMIDQILTWAGGDIITFDGRGQKELEPLNTENLLFIVGGAFQGHGGLSKIIQTRLMGDKGNKRVGFGENLKEQKYEGILHHLIPKDIVNYGFSPEFAGRFSIKVILDSLTTEDKIKILTDSKESILKSYENMWKVLGLNVELDSEIPKTIAERCEPETGARDLEVVCDRLFEPLLFNPEKYKGKDGKIKIYPELALEIIESQKPKLVLKQ